MSHTIHIRAKKPAHRHANCKTLCGKRVHSTKIVCVPGSKVKIDLNLPENHSRRNYNTKIWHQGFMDVLHTITENEADMMDDIYEGKMSRGDLWVPAPLGPERDTIRVRQMEWCEECFDSGRRGLKLFAKLEL